MREFKSLQPEELSAAYDSSIQGGEPSVTVQESETCIILQYTFPGFYISENTRQVKGTPISFIHIDISHTGTLSKSGKPLLPSFGRYVQIPFNCKYRIAVEKSEPVLFEGILVSPAQENLIDNEEDILEYDERFYKRDQFYPEDNVELQGPFEIDGYNALLIHVRPLQYNPARKRLRGYSTITLTLHLSYKETSHVFDSDLDKEAYGNLFLNPDRRKPEWGGGTAAAAGSEFIIIYHESLREAAQKLVKWKTMRGISTEAVSLRMVGDTVGKIKDYLRKKKDTKLRYVLFLGDVDMIPSETIKGGPSGNNITDYYYSTLRDPKDTFVFPWLSLGRIPIRNASEGMNVVEKIISYERDPPESSDYYRKMVFAAYFQDKNRDGKEDRGYMQTMEYLREQMTILGYEVERVYVSGSPTMREYSDGTAVGEEVRKAVVDAGTARRRLTSLSAEGCLIIGHRDHGDPSGWVHPPFGADQLKEGLCSLFYSINCLTGRFDLAGGKDSFAEKLLKLKGGAPSVIAATRPSHSWLNDDLIKGLFDATWGGIIPTFPGATGSYPVKYGRLGDLLNYAKTYLPVARSGEKVNIKDHFEIYHVVGDPTLEMWKSQPAKMDVRAVTRQNCLDITLQSCPRGCVLTAWQNDKMIKRVEPWSTRVRISLQDISASQAKISVCFWAPGYRFREVEAA